MLFHRIDLPITKMLPHKFYSWIAIARIWSSELQFYRENRSEMIGYRKHQQATATRLPRDSHPQGQKSSAGYGQHLEISMGTQPAISIIRSATARADILKSSPRANTCVEDPVGYEFSPNEEKSVACSFDSIPQSPECFHEILILGLQLLEFGPLNYNSTVKIAPWGSFD